jgi:uncharacterized membrane protein
MSKYLAFFAYLFSAIGAAFVLLTRRNDRLAVYHAKQSLGLLIVAVGVLLSWIVVGWVLAWIPYVGFIFAMALFALVIAAYIALIVCWFMGMHYALDEKMQPVPLVGDLILKIFRMKG